MPHVSKRKVEEEILNSLLKTFVSVLADCKNKREVAVFLDSILTETEKVMLGKRLGVMIMLQGKVPTTKIDKALKVTRMTIGKMKLIMKAGSEGYELALAKLKKRKDWQKLQKGLLQLARKVA